jgi:hypothetical protein
MEGVFHLGCPFIFSSKRIWWMGNRIILSEIANWRVRFTYGIEGIRKFGMRNEYNRKRIEAKQIRYEANRSEKRIFQSEYCETNMIRNEEKDNKTKWCEWNFFFKACGLVQCPQWHWTWTWIHTCVVHVCCMFMSLLHVTSMQQRHRHAAWTWTCTIAWLRTCSMEMDMQHVAWTRSMDKHMLLVHVNVHAACPSLLHVYCMSLLHVHVPAACPCL